MFVGSPITLTHFMPSTPKQFHTGMTGSVKDLRGVKIQCISYHFWRGSGMKHRHQVQIIKQQLYENATHKVCALDM